MLLIDALETTFIALVGPLSGNVAAGGQAISCDFSRYSSRVDMPSK